VVTLAGIVLTLAAQYSMGESWRIGVDPAERTELVTAGAFRYARNPIFTAMLVTATGLAMTIPNIISIIGLLALIAALEIQVRLVEEPYLIDTHGDTYRNYARQVGRFAPGTRPHRVNLAAPEHGPTRTTLHPANPRSPRRSWPTNDPHPMPGPSTLSRAPLADTT
jgi:steroid 5-alpha reductase family enzyme